MADNLSDSFLKNWILVDKELQKIISAEILIKKFDILKLEIFLKKFITKLKNSRIIII